MPAAASAQPRWLSASRTSGASPWGAPWATPSAWSPPAARTPACCCAPQVSGPWHTGPDGSCCCYSCGHSYFTTELLVVTAKPLLSHTHTALALNAYCAPQAPAQRFHAPQSRICLTAVLPVVFPLDAFSRVRVMDFCFYFAILGKLTMVIPSSC